MSATIRLPSGLEATAADYAWRCADSVIERLLNTTIDPDGPGGEDPNPDYTLAQRAVRRFGGEVIAFDPTLEDEIAPPSEQPRVR